MAARPQCTASEMTETPVGAVVQHIRGLADPHRQYVAAGDARACWGRIIVSASTGNATADPEPGPEQHAACLDLGWLNTMSGEVSEARRHDERAGPGTI